MIRKDRQSQQYFEYFILDRAYATCFGLKKSHRLALIEIAFANLFTVSWMLYLPLYQILLSVSL